MIKDYFLLALGNLRHRGLRSWLTILGVFIGIAAVVSLISMGQGLEAAITGQFGELAVDILDVQNKGVGFGPPGSTVIEKLNDNDLETIESVQGVEKVIPRLIKIGSLEYNEVSGFGYAIDIPEEEEFIEFIYDRFSFEAEEGRLLRAGDVGKVMLGNGFLESDDFGKDFRVGKTVKVNGKYLEIVGFLKQTDNFQLNNMVFMMNNDLEELFDIEGEYDLLIVQVRDKGEIENVAENIERKLRRDRNEKIGEETFTVSTPLQVLESVSTILNIINLIVVGIAGISLLVGGIGIANTMYTSVLERTREIGVMKAVGARNKDILFVFLIESGLLGLIGGTAGALIGLGGAISISNAANQALGSELFQIAISYPLIIGSVSFSFFIGILSGIVPAMQASKLNVVDSLRK
jgi:putative ABC transport system permease protein